MTAEKLRDLIFSLHTRKFGTVAEKLSESVLIKLGLVVNKSDSIHYDRKINDSKDEIKASRVLAKSTLDLETNNILEALEKHEVQRHVNLNQAQEVEWDSNIQQVKTDCFQSLWYCLFFADKVCIFKISNTQIHEDTNISYSDKQHKGNVGEGQFHVTNKNINYHLENYLVKTLTYEEVYENLSEKK